MQIGLEGVCGHCEADQPLDGSRLGGTDCDDGGDNGIRSKETTNCVGDMDIIHVAVHERGPSGSPAGNVQLIGKAYHGGLKPNCWRHSSTGRSRRLGRRRRRRARRQQRWWRWCVRSAACGSEDECGTKEHARRLCATGFAATGGVLRSIAGGVEANPRVSTPEKHTHQRRRCRHLSRR
eukprot:scaffold110230_cov66-Phaeocystis_antarctica.AAC.7